MTANAIIAQVLALLGLGSNIASVQCRRRIWVLAFQIAANIFYGLQYIFLGVWSAFAVSITSALECIVVYGYANGSQAEQRRHPLPLAVLLAIMAITTIFGLVGYAEPLDLLPIIVTVVYSWAVWQSNLRTFRLVAMLIPVCWFIYNMQVGAWVSMCTAVVEFGSAVAAVIRIDMLKYNHNHGGKKHN